MTIFSQVTNLHLYTNNLSYPESDYANNNKHIRHIKKMHDNQII